MTAADGVETAMGAEAALTPGAAARARRLDPTQRPNQRVIALGEPSPTPRVFLRFTCLKQALGHACCETQSEVGGVLIGETYRSVCGQVTELVAALPAVTEQASFAHITFTHDAWERIFREVDAMGPDTRILGWYHSHPGFGIFLSEQDRFIQRSCFGAPEAVALVLDPLKSRLGLFGWRPRGPFWGRRRRLESLGGLRLIARLCQLQAAQSLLDGLCYEAPQSAWAPRGLLRGLGERLGVAARVR